VAIGLLLVVAALATYLVTFVERPYDHFVWQAAAFLEGHAAIRYPVAPSGDLPGNAWFQDVLPVAMTDGIARGLLPFPPLPAVLLVPFVALWGLTTNDQAIFTVLAAADVGLCWWAIGRLPVGTAVRLGTTVFFAFGTVFWFTAQVSTTWYQAHIAAVGLSFLAIGLAVGADPGSVGAALDEDAASEIREADPSIATATPGKIATPDETATLGETDRPATADSQLPRSPRRGMPRIDPRQVAAGFLFGLACTARVPVAFGAPFFAFVGGGARWRERAWSAGIGAAIPIVSLVAYTLVSTGQPVSPAYEALYRLETAVYGPLGYHADWAIEDPRYVPQSMGIAILGLPDLLPARLPDALGIDPTPVCTEPGAVRGLFDVACPLAVPRDTGMSVLLTSPAYLLALPILGRLRRSRIVAGSLVAVAAIGLFDLMHFSQGWVQFGYRFSNDAAPFALVLVALGFERLADRRRYGMLLAMGLVVVSLAVNLWGVLWSRLLGW